MPPAIRVDRDEPTGPERQPERICPKHRPHLLFHGVWYLKTVEAPRRVRHCRRPPQLGRGTRRGRRAVAAAATRTAIGAALAVDRNLGIVARLGEVEPIDAPPPPVRPADASARSALRAQPCRPAARVDHGRIVVAATPAASAERLVRHPADRSARTSGRPSGHLQRRRRQTRIVPMGDDHGSRLRSRRWTQRGSGATPTGRQEDPRTRECSVPRRPRLPRSGLVRAFAFGRTHVTEPHRPTSRQRISAIRRRDTRQNDTRDSLHRCSRRAGRTINQAPSWMGLDVGDLAVPTSSGLSLLGNERGGRTRLRLVDGFPAVAVGAHERTQ